MAAAHRPAAILIGPPGAGKTTIGRRLAKALRVDFLDIDEEIERREGRSIRRSSPATASSRSV